MKNQLPIADLHCDLLAYLLENDCASAEDSEAIGCAFPHLRAGGVKLQVLAIYTATAPASTELARRQGEIYRRLLGEHPPCRLAAALENASGIAEEDEPLERAFARLEQLLAATGGLVYISLTHFAENRFGGGDRSAAGLKDDGRALLEHLDGRGIAIDLSHASDALAGDILAHIDRRALDLRVLASHSNFRALCEHPRNLPAEFAQEIVRRGGVIGMNFLRAYLHPDDPAALQRHILHGFASGAARALCFGADFFFPGDHPDPSRAPFYFPEHASASRYPAILEALAADLDSEQLQDLAWRNAERFLAPR